MKNFNFSTSVHLISFDDFSCGYDPNLTRQAYILINFEDAKDYNNSNFDYPVRA